LKSLVLPAYNPGPLLERTFAAVLDFIRSRDPQWEVVFVLDGCTDGSEERLAELVQDANEPAIRVLSHSPNRGKGYAVRRGLLAANGRVRIFTDVDLAYGLDQVVDLAWALQSGAQVAIASREAPGSRVQLPFEMLSWALRRRMQSRVFGTIVRTLLPIQERDTQAGLKGMTAAVARALLPRLACDGFGFDCEFLTACHANDIPVRELAVDVSFDDAASTTGWKASVSMLRELLAIRRRWKEKALTAHTPAAEPATVRRAA
jgi:dolichyl-phosphate beta-glucosyltransferase